VFATKFDKISHIPKIFIMATL